METLLNSETSLLEKMEVFNCLTTFQCAQLSQLKQWSLLHANQAVVPQATPVPGFERLMLLPQMFEQDIPAFTKPTFGLTQKKSFLDDLSDVDDLFNGPSDCSMFNLNPEKDIDQVPDRTGFDEFLDEVLSEQGSYTPSKTPSVTKNEEITQESYDLVHSQPNSPLYSQPSGPLYSQSFHSQPRSPTQSECNNSLHNQPNSPFQSQPNSPYHSQPNSPTQSHSQLDSPYYSQPNSPLHSQPNSPLDNPLNSLSCSPPVSPVSPSISEAGSNTYSTDEGIGSQSDISECGDDVFFSVSSPISDGTEQQLLPFIKQEPDILSTKTGRRKRGPRPQVKYTGDGPMQLWQFLLELLIAPEYSKLVKWTQDEDYEFKILKPSQVAKMWGEKKNKPTMNYEKLSRGLRYYYGKSVIEKVHGKRYVYLFKCDIPKILGYDPMVTIKGEDCVEDSVCGEPIMSPKVEDLLVTSSAEDGTLAFL